MCSIDNNFSIGLQNGLAPIKRQAIILKLPLTHLLVWVKSHLLDNVHDALIGYIFQIVCVWKA